MRWQTRYREMVVKTKRSTILPYWQPNNLACCIFMDASRKHKTLGSETKKLYYTGFCKQHDFHWHWFPFLPKSLKGNAEGLKEWSTCSGFGSQLRNPQIRKSKSFITGLKQTYLNSVPGKMLFILYCIVNKTTLCLRTGNYLYPPRLFAVYIQLKRQP